MLSYYRHYPVNFIEKESNHVFMIEPKLLTSGKLHSSNTEVATPRGSWGGIRTIRTSGSPFRPRYESHNRGAESEVPTGTT